MMMNRPAAGGGGTAKAAPQFRYNTRQRRQYVGTIPINGFATRGSLQFTQVGLASRVILWVDARVSSTGGASGASAPFSPWNLINQASLDLNLGSTNICSLTGYGAYLKQAADARDQDFTTSLAGVTNDPLLQNPTITPAAAAQRVSFPLELPIGANSAANFGLGLINLQSPEVRMTLNLTFGQQSDLYTDANVYTVGGNVYVYIEYYEIPPPQRGVALPPLLVHRTVEDRTIFNTTGAVDYTLPRQGKLLRLLQYVVANGALVAGGGPANSGSANASVVGVDSRQLKFNITDSIYQDDYILDRFLLRQQYGAKELRAGTFAWDLFSAMGEPNRGDFRDVIDTEAISQIDAITVINSGVTLGSGNNYIGNIRQIIQPLSASAVTGGNT